MPIREILQYPDKRLRIIAKTVTDFSEELQKLIRDMLDTMYANNGVGLAATQIDIHQRVVVMDISEERNQPLIFINPHIIKKSGLIQSEEGCLSVKNYRDTLERAEEITVQYQDISGKHYERTDRTFFSICMQHECDHLNGIVYIDRLSKAQQKTYQHNKKNTLSS